MQFLPKEGFYEFQSAAAETVFGETLWTYMALWITKAKSTLILPLPGLPAKVKARFIDLFGKFIPVNAKKSSWQEKAYSRVKQSILSMYAFAVKTDNTNGSAGMQFMTRKLMPY